MQLNTERIPSEGRGCGIPSGGRGCGIRFLISDNGVYEGKLILDLLWVCTLEPNRDRLEDDYHNREVEGLLLINPSFSFSLQ